MKSARSKAKTAPAIDLPATDVREIATGSPDPCPAPEQAEHEDTPPRPDEPQEKAATPNDPARAPADLRLAPALIGLVAGAIGGFAAYQTSELSLFGSVPGGAPLVDKALITRLDALEQRLATARPGEGTVAIPQALVDRLAKAETLLAETVRHEAATREELGKLGINLANEASERKKAIEDLATRATAGPAGTAPPVAADLDRLKSRLDSVENEAQALSGRLAGRTARDSLGAANAHLAAVNLLDDVLARGAPLSGPLALLKNLGADAGLLASFTPFAASGVPNARKLLEELRALRPTPVAAPAEPNRGLLERMKRSALSLVEIRRTGDVTGSDDAAHLARAEQALGRDEISLALGLVSRLSPVATPRYAEWRSRAEALLKAGEARLALRNNAYAALAKAAATTK